VPQFVADRLSERLNRDEVRTPMQWDDGPNAGFCPPGVLPWLPVNTDYERVNVEAQVDRPDSMLGLYRQLFALRRDTPSLRTAPVAALSGLPDGLLGYRRNEIVVLANMGSAPVTVHHSGDVLVETGEVAVGTGRTSLFADSAVVLRTVVPRMT
jgi:glycosidase